MTFIDGYSSTSAASSESNPFPRAHSADLSAVPFRFQGGLLPAYTTITPQEPLDPLLKSNECSRTSATQVPVGTTQLPALVDEPPTYNETLLPSSTAKEFPLLDQVISGREGEVDPDIGKLLASVKSGWSRSIWS